MGNFVTRDIEYLRDELSKVYIMLPRQGYNREEMSLYDILSYMTRFEHDVYLVKLKDGRYRAVYDIHSEIFEGDSEVDAFYDMIMSFIKNGDDYYVTPPKPHWEDRKEHNKPMVEYAEL